MTAALIVLAVLVLLAVCPIRFRVSARLDGKSSDFSVRGLFGVVPFFTYPRPPEKLDLRQYSYTALRRRAEKLEKNERKEQAKQKKKTEKRQSPAKDKKPQNGESRIKRLLHLLKLAAALLKILLRKFGEYLRVDVRQFEVHIVGRDPAETAVVYGSVLAAAESLWGAVAGTPPMKRVRKSQLQFFADFTSPASTLAMDVTFSVTVWQTAVIGIAALRTYFRTRAERDEKESTDDKKAREQREAAARADVLKELRK